jgi:hypothetical protein
MYFCRQTFFIGENKYVLMQELISHFRSNVDSHTHTHNTHIHSLTYTCTHTLTHNTHIHSLTYTHTHTHTQHSHTLTHTHTHSHTCNEIYNTIMLRFNFGFIFRNYKFYHL